MQQATERMGARLRRAIASGMAMTVILFLLPALTVQGEPLYKPEQELMSERTEKPEESTEQTQTVGIKDRGRPVRLRMEDGSVQELTMDAYLWGVVAAEMPATFEVEALKAQVCAARTYTVMKQNSESRKHPDADICADSTCCQAYVERDAARARWGLSAGEYTRKLEQAVAETDGLGILYDGQPIQALFFSSSPGKTVDAVAVWGSSVDYLKSVDSPEGEEVPDYHSQVLLSREQVRQTVLVSYPGANLSGEEQGWFSGAQCSEAGTVITMQVGGLTLTGGQIRSLFSLRSAAFSVCWNGDAFVFDVTGYGHGVGMSQYGANALAREGKGFQEILTWYYTGTTVDDLW